MKPSPLDLYFEDFVINEEIKHSLSKTIFESDNNPFSLLTINHHPIHTNFDYAKENQHKQVPTVGMTVPEISSKSITNLGYDAIKHHNSFFINDTLYAPTRVIGKKKSKTKSDRGTVYVETIASN